MHGLRVTDVLAAAAVYEVPVSELLKRRSRNAEARRTAMYLTSRFSWHAQRLSELGKHFGVSGAGLSIAAKRMGDALSARRKKALRSRCKQAEWLLKEGRAC